MCLTLACCCYVYFCHLMKNLSLWRQLLKYLSGEFFVTASGRLLSFIHMVVLYFWNNCILSVEYVSVIKSNYFSKLSTFRTKSLKSFHLACVFPWRVFLASLIALQGGFREKSMTSSQNINSPPTVHETRPNEGNEISNNLFPVGRLPYLPRRL